MIGLDVAERRLYVPGQDEFVIPETPSVAVADRFQDSAVDNGATVFDVFRMPDYPPQRHNRKIFDAVVDLAGHDPDSRQYLEGVKCPEDLLYMEPPRSAGLFFKLDERPQLYSPELPVFDIRQTVELDHLIYEKKIGSNDLSSVAVGVAANPRNGWALSKIYSGDCTCVRTMDPGSTHMQYHNLDGSADQLELVLAALAYNHQVHQEQQVQDG